MSRLIIITGFILMLAACAAETNPTPTTLPTPDPTDAATLETPADDVTPELRAEEFAPRPIEFDAADGTTLSGNFFPAAQPDAPGVVLVHMLGDDRQVWVETGFAAILQNVALASGLQRDQSYAVLTFDLRGHGESSGERSRPDYPQDVAAALNTLRAMEGVDPDRIGLVGASIGADSVVAGCGAGCQTAVSLSPGGFTGTPYAEAVETLPDGVAVLCVAAENDGQTAEACRSAEGAAPGPYITQIYEGRAHGTALFGVEQEPELEIVLLEWLDGQLTE